MTKHFLRAACKFIKYLKGQSSEILILFLTYIDRPRPEYEPLLLLKFFRGPTIFDQRTFSSRGSGEILSEKLHFSENFYK
jgi:hypothetical protein